MDLEIIVRRREKGAVIEESIIKSVEIKKPTSLMEVGFNHAKQVSIIGELQNNYIPTQCSLLFEEDGVCSRCGKKAMKNGKHTVSFHASLSDHRIKAQGYSCKCGWQSKPTIHGRFGSNVHPDLIKIQATLGSKMPYKDAQISLTKFSCSSRTVNNHVKIAEATNKIGEMLHSIKTEEIVEIKKESEELYLQVDGGHIRDKGKDKQSFEAMISTVYSPESYRRVSEDKNEIKSKHVAASALKDQGSTINQLTLKAAQKEGLSKNTIITAFCDGAANCWSVVDYLEPYCKKINKILDWFHIRQYYDRAITENSPKFSNPNANVGL